MQLSLLNQNIRAGFLLRMKITIRKEMNKVPMTMAYALALETCKNTVNEKFSNDPFAHKKYRYLHDLCKKANG